MENNDRTHGLRLVTTCDGEQTLAREAFARLEEGRAMLREAGQTETVRLLDIVLLQLRVSYHGICAAELTTLCDALTVPVASDDRLRGA